MQRIIAISDLHGYLPEIEYETDILLIAGDLFPLEVQRSTSLSEEWLRSEFADWAKNVPAKYIVMVAGNHDFFFERVSPIKTELILGEVGLAEKVFYLENTLIEIEGIKIFGCPYCSGPFGWAFCPSDSVDWVKPKYDMIQDCDILLCHQPPKVGKVGCSYPGKPYERNFGSEYLAEVISKKNIGAVVCGHIHGGQHDGVDYNGTMVYNVSLKDEDYKVNYLPTKLILN